MVYIIPIIALPIECKGIPIPLGVDKIKKTMHSEISTSNKYLINIWPTQTLQTVQPTKWTTLQL